MRIHNKLHNIIQEEALQINSELFQTSTLNYLQTKLLLCNINSLEFKMWKHFDTKQKSKLFTLCDCV